VKKRLPLAIGLIFIAGAIITLGYLSWNASIRTDRRQLPRYGNARDFELTDQDGVKVGTKQLRGQTWVANFFDPADPGQSALLASRFAELDQNFQKANQLSLVSIVIPKSSQDRPVLAGLARRYLATSHWKFVTGNSDEVGQIEKLFPVGSAGTSAVTRCFYLIDAEGLIRGVYDGQSPESVQRLLDDIGTLLRTGSK
jgi:protein SCO1/2